MQIYRLTGHMLSSWHCITETDIKRPITPSDQLLALIDQVRGHFTVTHKLLEAQKVQAASPQTEEKVYYKHIYVTRQHLHHNTLKV